MPSDLPEDDSHIREGADSEKCPRADERPEVVPHEEAPRDGEAGKDSTPSKLPASNQPRKRADRGHLHATRHGVLSRCPLEALQKLGEDIRKIRRLERRYRESLKPVGAIGLMVFDRFWSSYTRLLLAARIETSLIVPGVASADPHKAPPQLNELEVPTLVFSDKSEVVSITQILPADLTRELALIQRYDCHFSRELYRSLHLLLVMREGGEDGLTLLLNNISRHTIK
jgi:hypothetical protein